MLMSKMGAFIAKMFTTLGLMVSFLGCDSRKIICDVIVKN